jgi:hypothetical protein
MVDEHQIYDLRMKKEGKNNTRENVILKGLVEFLCALEQEDFLQSQYESLSHIQKEEIEESMEKKECPLAYLKLLKNDVVRVVCLLFGQREQ